MRVLHLPKNVASVMSYNVQALRTAGVRVSAMAFEGEGRLVDGSGLRLVRSRSQPTWVARATVSLPPARSMGARGSLVLAGLIPPAWSGLRDTQSLSRSSSGPMAGTESAIRKSSSETIRSSGSSGIAMHRFVCANREGSQRIQRLFHSAGFVPMVATGMEQYIDRTLYPTVITIERCMDLRSFEFAALETHRQRLRIAHMPSKRAFKGTIFVLEAVKMLRESGLDFDFDLIENTTRSVALKRLQASDVFVRSAPSG